MSTVLVGVLFCLVPRFRLILIHYHPPRASSRTIRARAGYSLVAAQHVRIAPPLLGTSASPAGMHCVPAGG